MSTPEERERRRRRKRFILKRCRYCHKEIFTSYPRAQRMVLKIWWEKEVDLYIYYCEIDHDHYHTTKMEEHDERGDVI